MQNTLRNFWIDILLFLLLGMDIALISLARRTPGGAHPGAAWHIHVLVSLLMTFVCLVHVSLHWRWFQAVLTGRAKGRIKLIMNSLVVLAMMIANLSGHVVLGTNVASRLHSLTGCFALLGLFVHAVKHTRWMVMTTRRLTGEPRPLPQMPSATK